MLETVIFESDTTDETVDCDECGLTGLDAGESEFSSYHGEAPDGNYCDDCMPRCYCRDCDPDYYNDIRSDR